MKKQTATALAALVVAGAPGFAGDLAQALGETDVAVALRYRFEQVARDVAGEKDAEASTLRTAVQLETGEYRDLKIFAEVENVAVLGDDRYDNRGFGSLGNGVTDRAVVADPALTEFNQAYLEFAPGDTRLRLGRQEILIGDVRFVGNVGWRQNHQAFEGLRLDHEFNDRLSLTYAYIDSVERIFGDSRGIDAHVLALDVGADPIGLRLYGLSLDWDDAVLSGLSTTTLGAEISGKTRGGAWRGLYEFEWATQSDTGDNPGTVEANYLHAMVGGAFEAVTVKLGWEELEGSPGDGRFSTPLATLHKFNGWADLFLATPENGLVDTYVQANGTSGRVAWLARYHQFESSSGSVDYGDEIDAQVSYVTSWKQTIALKVALYGADAFGVDTDKWMLWSTYSF